MVYAYNISTWVTEAAVPEGPDHLQLYIKFKASSGYILSSKLAWAIENLASREGKQKQGQGGRKTIRRGHQSDPAWRDTRQCDLNDGTPISE